YGLGIAIDHEDVATDAIECDAIRVVFRLEAFQNFECLKIEDDDLASFPIVGIALAVYRHGAVRAAGNSFDIAQELAASGIHHGNLVAMGDKDAMSILVID